MHCVPGKTKEMGCLCMARCKVACSSLNDSNPVFDIQQMTNAELTFWVSRFILEVQKKIGRAPSKHIVPDDMWASNIHTRDKTLF